MRLYYGFILILLGWLIPNTSKPWVSFWNESISILGLIYCQIFLIKELKNTKISKLLFLVLSLLTFTLILDFFSRESTYYGDYILGIFFICSFISAIHLGNNLFHEKKIWFFLVFIFSLISSSMAIAQWLNLDINQLYFLSHKNGTRSFGNIGQANHLATIILWGIISLQYLEKEISSKIYYCTLFILSIGLASTQSRTAICGIIAFTLIICIYKKRQIISASYLKIYSTAIFVITSFITLPEISKLIGSNSERNIDAIFTPGSRITHWKGLLEAIWLEKWRGYGWLRSAEAHLIGTSHQGNELIFQYAHNFFLDLIIWFGVPSGIILIYFISKFLINTIKEVSSEEQVYAYSAFTVFFIHCLLEYPFAYLYLLIPAGIFLGISQEINKKNISVLHKNYHKAITLLMASLSLIITFDYIKIESYSTNLRFRYLRIGNAYEKIYPPNIFIINQALEFSKRSYQRPVKGKNETEEFSKAATRFGTQRILFHTAIAYELNGETKKSEAHINAICRINSERVCSFTKNEFLKFKER